ncbi:MAG: hypothetical protein PF482_07955 [Desulfobacteraceae bacterium]|jgi:hypothetical protein|nr:hypothetical protein [Desulfobacteraceae bacterium]
MLITGRRKIEKQMSLTWPTIKKLYQEQGLPLIRLGLKWGLETDHLQEWLRKQSEVNRWKGVE